MSYIKTFHDTLLNKLKITQPDHIALLPWLICLHLRLKAGQLWKILDQSVRTHAIADETLQPHQIHQAIWFHEALTHLLLYGISSEQVKQSKQLSRWTDHQKTLTTLITKIQQDLDWLHVHADHHLISIQHHHYPDLLKQISDPPFLLYVQGNPEHLNHSKPIAIVGSRHPTRYGIETADKFATQLAQEHWSIHSGFALGIDAAAHQGALAAGGVTIAVLGNGIDYDYPKAHKHLRQQICQNGALISEFPLHTIPEPYHFPLRNRLISGMSHGVLVVEAGNKSGSLLTAKMALEQNRDVFAIPGLIHNPASRGCHWLIKQGAKLTESVADIHAELHTEKTLPTKLKQPTPKIQVKIRQAILKIERAQT